MPPVLADLRRVATLWVNINSYSANLTDLEGRLFVFATSEPSLLLDTRDSF